MSWWEHLRAFGVAFVAMAGIVGLLGLLIQYAKGSNWIEANGTLLFTHALYLMVFPPMIRVARGLGDHGSFRAPRVRLVKEGPLLLVDTQQWLSYGTLVAVFRLDGDFEGFVCAGTVSNIQANALTQIRCHATDGGESALYDRLNGSRSELIIKPGVDR